MAQLSGGTDTSNPDRGISEALARARSARLGDLHYDLLLSVPEDHQAPIAARMTIAFRLRDASEPLALDFNPTGAGCLQAVTVNGQPASPPLVDEHIVLPAQLLRSGGNTVTCDFIAGDAPLNRSDELLYSLFVPARARDALPCFDQPDLKGRWTLTLDVPQGWQALANGVETSCESQRGRTRFTFAATPPISTYLLAFAAGRLSIEHAERGGRPFRMFHREADRGKVARSFDAIVDLHATSLGWLERYTGVPYPFGKVDFLAIPAFQFSGMEHPGAVFYNAASLLLEETATQNQTLDRASLIAHETSHLWFGDLVTMRWFDDVWMKEVFATVMAGKIVDSVFPGLNHDLRFLHAHYPAAYEVDRTEGTNPIRQSLANLNEAGALYGAIIYHKSPIVMRQLETLMGAEAFRAGLREYLNRYAFDCASWPDLVEILDRWKPGAVAEWSRSWVDARGRPTLETSVTVEQGRIARLALVDTTMRPGLTWAQEVTVSLVYSDRVDVVRVQTGPQIGEVEEARGLPAPAAVLPGGESGYGAFHLDGASLAWLCRELPQVPDPLTRGAAWLTLWDAMLEREVRPEVVIDLAVRALPQETEELNAQRILAYLTQAFWRFLSPSQRINLAGRVEQTLRDGLDRSTGTTLGAAYFAALRDVALTPSAVGWLEAMWRNRERVSGLAPGESDDIVLALELAVRGVSGWDAILAAQIARTKNPDWRARLEFVRPALSGDPVVRAAFFSCLRSLSNRRREPWVLEGLRYLHHPLRSQASVGFIRPSLDLLAEIRRTGDIFFPARWVGATLGGHQSLEAVREVRAFLDGLPADYPERLRRIVLAAADPLFRASAIAHGSG